MSDEMIESELTGNTLRVYWVLLRSQAGSVGVREVQRGLGFSSPALASYHLGKLEELGLVEKTNGEYRLRREVRVGVLRQFARVGSLVFPRLMLYAALFSTLLLFYLTQFRVVSFYSVFGLVFGLLATGVFWFEAVRVWRQRP